MELVVQKPDFAVGIELLDRKVGLEMLVDLDYLEIMDQFVD